MSLLVTGSIGVDTVTTPYGVSENCIGGSAVYFSMAASFFSPVRLIGVIGPDCPFDLAEVFAGRDVDLSGLEVREQSKTFRWKGSYRNSMNEVITDDIELLYVPPGHYCSPIVNTDEARALTAESNVIRAAEVVLSMGPSVAIIKKGESGSIMCNADGGKFVLPAFPADKVKDPTGAGDSFAGGFMGYLAQVGKTDFDSLKTAIAYGTVVASFTISDFSLQGLTSIEKADIDKRFETLQRVTQF